MRTSDGRVTELHRRMEERKIMKERRRYHLVSASTAVAGIVLVVLFAVMISGTPVTAPVMASGSMSASIFSDNAALGCVVVAIVSFCLGALVTALCYRLKKRSGDGENDDDREL